MTDLFNDLHPSMEPTPEQEMRVRARISRQKASRRRRRAAIGALAVVLVAAGTYVGAAALRWGTASVQIATDTSESVSDRVTTEDLAARFWGNKWRLISLTEAGVNQVVVDSSATASSSPSENVPLLNLMNQPIVLDASESFVEFRVCNIMTIGVDLVGDHLIGDEGAVTDMACSSPFDAPRGPGELSLEEMDDHLWDLISGATVGISGTTLTLTNGDAIGEFEQVLNDPEAQKLWGNKWRLTRLTEGGVDQTVVNRDATASVAPPENVPLMNIENEPIVIDASNTGVFEFQVCAVTTIAMDLLGDQLIEGRSGSRTDMRCPWNPETTRGQGELSPEEMDLQLSTLIDGATVDISGTNLTLTNGDLIGEFERQ